MSSKKQRKKRKLRILPCLILLLISGSICIGMGICAGKVFANMHSTETDDVKAYKDATVANTNNDVYGKLQELVNEDERINRILNNPDSYPKELLEMLVKDPDLLDFVLDYPSRKGENYTDTIGNIEAGEIPFLLQWDQRWGYAAYGDQFIAVNGCAPTALSMVIAYLCDDNTITPYTIARFADKNGYYISGVGSSWDLMNAAASYFGIACEQLILNEDTVFSILKQGNPIICSMLPGDFTSSGHFIVLAGIENGKIKVHDPNSKKRSHQLWDYDTLANQIAALWAFYLP